MAIEGWVGLGIGLLGFAALVLGVARQTSRPSGSARAAQVAIVSIGAIWVLVGVVAPSFVFAAWGAIHLGTAGGIAIGSRWAHALEVVLGMITVLGVGFVAFFSIALTMSAGGDLGRPMLGTGVFGVLNGWVSLLVFALFIGSGTLMVFAGLHGSARIARLVDDRPGSAPPRSGWVRIRTVEIGLPGSLLGQPTGHQPCQPSAKSTSLSVRDRGTADHPVTRPYQARPNQAWVSIQPDQRWRPDRVLPGTWARP